MSENLLATAIVLSFSGEISPSLSISALHVIRLYPASFDARQWVKAIKASGAKYICFTSRHHDGFSLYDTAYSDYDIMDASPFKRDVMAELAAACKEEGLDLHIYYSLIDWTREDYPAGRTGRKSKNLNNSDWQSYKQFMKDQLGEILKYDGVKAIWFDGVWDHDSDHVPFDWDLDEIYSHIHAINPACLIGNNHHLTPFKGEDFQMFERDLPGENTTGWAADQTISKLPLEMCQTMNGMWGYKVEDQKYKSVTELVRLIVKAAAKGSNLLLNIGLRSFSSASLIVKFTNAPVDLPIQFSCCILMLGR